MTNERKGGEIAWTGCQIVGEEQLSASSKGPLKGGKEKRREKKRTIHGGIGRCSHEHPSAGDKISQAAGVLRNFVHILGNKRLPTG